MVKLVYTTDSKSVAFGRGGSSPPTATKFKGSALVYARALLYKAFIFFGREILAGRNSQLSLFSRFCGYVFGVIWRKGVFHGYHSNP